MSCVAAARAPRCPSRVPWATTPSEAIESERARCVVAAEHARGTTRPPTDAVLLLSLPMATGFHRERGGNENGARPGPKRKGVASRTQRIGINSAFHGKPCRWSDPSPGREDGPRPTPNLIDGCGLGLGRARDGARPARTERDSWGLLGAKRSSSALWDPITNITFSSTGSGAPFFSLSLVAKWTRGDNDGRVTSRLGSW
jgi:hypothetical protein